MFDTINNIFLNEKNGQLSLCLEIYEKLHKYLATNFQYLHQFAKCNINISYIIKNNEKKINHIEKAIELSKIALTLVENEYARNNAESLKITKAHILYTIATATCILYKLTQNKDLMNGAVDAVYDAVCSKYNKDTNLNEDKRYGDIIHDFLLEATMKKEELSLESKIKLEEVLSCSI